MPKVDVFILNQEEFRLLPQLKPAELPPITCITNGSNGGQIVTPTETISFHSKKTKVVEETGAGDAFGSGFVAALINKLPVETAIKWGTNQAASVIGFMGAKQGLLSFDQINTL